MCDLCPSEAPPVLFPYSPPERANGRDRSVLSARDTSCASVDAFCEVHESWQCWREKRERPFARTGCAEQSGPWWLVATQYAQATFYAFGGPLCVSPCKHSTPARLPFVPL